MRGGIYRRFLGLFGALLLLCIQVAAEQAKISISGTVLESQDRQPVEFATVMVLEPGSDRLITGTTTGDGGRFQVVSTVPEFILEISFIGFVSRRIESFTIDNNRVDLGEILLDADTETLDEVVVQAERSQTVFKLDKRVFNVGTDLSSSGASALEVLNNVPSVNVNIEGQISLRGSMGVQILINGKPSVLADDDGIGLGSITADMIEKIEVITNPSAKYEAEGTAGIINIVLKKEDRKGTNGSISINTGIPHNHSLGFSMNHRTERFNFFGQTGLGYRSLPRTTENANDNRPTGGPLILSDGIEYRNEFFYNVRLGLDYLIDKQNVLTFSGNFAYEVERQPSEFEFTQFDGTDRNLWRRTESTEATNPKWQYEFQYKRDFKGHKDHDLVFSAIGNFFGKDLESDFLDRTISGNRLDREQITETEFKESKYTFNLDYTRPIGEQYTIEAGAQYVLQDVSNDYAVSDLEGEVFIPDSGLTNVFDYVQNVLGIYGTAAYEGEHWGIKVGLRMEYTDLETILVTTEEENDQNYTNLFPSLHTSYKFSDYFAIQAGYSRRIYRPRLWDLNPFFNIRNNFVIRTGNPKLGPEFTDSYELNGIYTLEDASFNLGVYYRYTTDLIERISIFENNVNLTMPMNVGTNRIVGLEFNAKYNPTRWLSLFGDVNFSYFKREGEFEGQAFGFTGDQWTSKITSKFKLPADFDFEVTGNFNSRYETVQSRVSENIFADLGLRKKFKKGKYVLNFSIRDVFKTRRMESEINTDDFYLYTFRQRGRFVTLGFSYGFGKGEAMTYSGRRR